MKFYINLKVELERADGKPAKREELAKALLDIIADADPGVIETDDEANYSVEGWEVKEWRPQ